MEIVEKISMTVEVDAQSAEKAVLQIIEKYRVEQIVMESNEGMKVDFLYRRLKSDSRQHRPDKRVAQSIR